MSEEYPSEEENMGKMTQEEMETEWLHDIKRRLHFERAYKRWHKIALKYKAQVKELKKNGRQA